MFTFENYFCGLAIIIIALDFMAYKMLKAGRPFTEDPDMWSLKGYGDCFLWGLILLNTTLTLVFMIFGDLPTKDLWSAGFFIGVILFVINLVVVLIIFNNLLEPIQIYKEDCVRFNVDINEYIGMHFAKVKTQYYYKNENKYSLVIYKVYPVKALLGNYSKIQRVETISTFKEYPKKEQLSKEVNDYFKTHPTYLVEDKRLEKVESNFEVILIKD